MSSSSIRTEPSRQSESFWSYVVDTSSPFDIEGIPLKLYALLAFLSVLVLQMELLTRAGVAGAFAIMWSIGFFFFVVGERVHLLRALLGGGLVVAYAGAAATAHAGLVDPQEIEFLQSHMIGSRFFYFLLATLLISGVLSVPSAVLRKSLVSYAPIILGGLFFSAMGGITAGWLVGLPVERVVTMFFLPIMGGGVGAGAIPMSEIYADVTGRDASAYFNYAIAVLTLGNIVAILTGSLLARLGQKLPFLSGDGRLVREVVEEATTNDNVDEGETNTQSAMIFIVCILVAGLILSESVGAIHLFAWVTIIVVLLNVSKVVSPATQASLRQLNAWVVRAFLVTLLVAFGLSANIDVIAEILSLSNLFVVAAIVVFAGVGAGLTSHFVNCYPIEGALSGGLCMANAGGSGDLQVLGAARRLELFPYAQISSRLGGAFMLILANYLFALFT